VLRLLLLGALTLAFAADAGAAGKAPAASCTSSQLRVSVQTQGVATAAWIALTVRNRGVACALGGSAVFTVDQSGRRAAVGGNPLRIPVRGQLGRGHTRLVKAAWSNWCHARRNLSLVARYAGVTRRMPFRALPACIDRKRPSQLAPIT